MSAKYVNIPLTQRCRWLLQPYQNLDKIFLDLVQIPESDLGNKYILTMQDELSKFTAAIPIRTKEVAEVAEALVEQILLRFGMVKEIAPDQGTEFINAVMRQICTLLANKASTFNCLSPRIDKKLKIRGNVKY